MEPLGDQWNNVLLNGIFSNDDTEFMAQLLGNSSLSSESSSCFSSAFWPTDDSTTPTYPNVHKYHMYPSSDNTNNENTFSSSFTQGNSYNTGETYYLNGNTRQLDSSFSFGLMDNSNRSSLSSFNFSFGENITKEDSILQTQAQGVVPLQAKHLPELPLRQTSDEHHLMENSKKRPQTSSDHLAVQNQKKRNVKAKKNHNVKVNYNNNSNRHSSKTSSCGCSEGGDDDIDHHNSSMNATSQSQSQSQSEDVSYGKGKGSRGSASDPQSLYARKRREKINDRLKVLQNLVPNGTKVDISTMLEEAVQYVKFLQLQIKLLSSDDHWMYAPIAYNGMDIGLNMTIPNPTSTTSS